MRDVDWGWLIRYMHSTGASAFFIVVYLHMFRALLYGSHRKPRELLWIFGCLIFLVLMAEGFMGYVLPWGNMSYWGAQVIISLFGSLPVIGGSLVEWIRGDYVIADATLNRFFALHVAALPLALIFLVIAHLMALHEVGSNNPDGIEIKEHKDAGRPSARRHPVPSLLHGEGSGRGDGLPGDVLRRDLLRAHVRRPVSRSRRISSPPIRCRRRRISRRSGTSRRSTRCCAPCPRSAGTQVWGVLVMGASIVVLFFVPWLDRSPVKSIRYRGPIYKVMLADLRGVVHRPRALRPEAAGGHLPDAGQDLHRPVFRFLSC